MDEEQHRKITKAMVEYAVPHGYTSLVQHAFTIVAISITMVGLAMFEHSGNTTGAVTVLSGLTMWTIDYYGSKLYRQLAKPSDNPFYFDFVCAAVVYAAYATITPSIINTILYASTV